MPWSSYTMRSPTTVIAMRATRGSRSRTSATLSHPSACSRLAEAAPDASFFEIPRRNHFNAPTSRDFREAAIAFLSQER